MSKLLVLLYAALLVCLAVTVIAALWLENVPAFTNAVLATVLAIVPSVAPLPTGAASAPVLGAAPLLSTWIAGAGLVHTVGMFGPYDAVWWWDHLTHTLSATLLAALIYAILLVTEPRIAVVGDGPVVWIGGTLLCTLAFGVVWEFLELLAREIGEQRGIDPVLEYYGLRDTFLDLGFDGVGALIVIAFDLRVFVPIAERDPALLATSLGVSVGIGLLVVAGITFWIERWRRGDGAN